MGFFVEPNETVMQKVSSPDAWQQRDPKIAGEMEALATLRSMNGPEVMPGDSWKRVASVRGPILDIARCLDPDFLKDKRKFYAWLDSEEGRQWCTYDRRRGARSSRWFRFDGGFDGTQESSGGFSG